jgi:hypothetical protein
MGMGIVTWAEVAFGFCVMSTHDGYIREMLYSIRAWEGLVVSCDVAGIAAYCICVCMCVAYLLCCVALYMQ